MSRADDERIDDIVEAASEIAAIVATGREAWESDRVGPDVIGLRIVLAHHYHRVDPDQVWTIATKDVPALLDRLDTPRSRGDG